VSTLSLRNRCMLTWDKISTGIGSLLVEMADIGRLETQWCSEQRVKRIELGN